MTAYTAAIIGAGTIGSGWAARFLLLGWNVRVFDPDPATPARVSALLTDARRALPGLADVALPTEGALSFHDTMSSAVQHADWVQESVPERLELKRKVLQTLQAHCTDDAIVASSSLECAASDLQDCATRPEQIIIAQPLAPVYLLPVVELSAGPKTPPERLAHATRIVTDLGMSVIHRTGDAQGSFAGHLHKSVMASVQGLIADTGATPEQLSAAFAGIGLPLSQGGMMHTTGPISHTPDDPLAPPQQTIAERDETLVTLLRGLKQNETSLGQALTAFDQSHDQVPQRLDQIDDLHQPIRVVARAVPLNWTDFNGHMNEARYLEAFCQGTDRFMQLVGCDADYIARKHSYFTAETHICHLHEVRAGDQIDITVQVLAAEGKKMHLFSRLHTGGVLAATAEQVLVHVDLETRKSCAPLSQVVAALSEVARAHQRLQHPAQAGRSIGATQTPRLIHNDAQAS